MSGSIFGKQFQISTFGESHGKGIGVIVDGCPAGLILNEEIIQSYLNRRKPGTNKFSTPRKENDSVQLISGVFEGKTTGTSIAMLIQNETQRSHDYSEILNIYRPGHADYTFDMKYGFRDYRGGGRSSGRETIGRVAAGAIALELLKSLGITVTAYSKSIGPIHVNPERFDLSVRDQNPFYMPDEEAAKECEVYLKGQMEAKDSTGGIIECVVDGCPVGLGEPVFDKLDANLAKAVLSIGAVKGVEFGDGFGVATMSGSVNNDAFTYDEEGNITKKSNHSGGILGGLSDGSQIVLRAAFKPTPSIFQNQETVNKDGENVSIQIKGRHDPIIVPRAVVVVESMVALTLIDHLFLSMTSRLDRIQEFFSR